MEQESQKKKKTVQPAAEKKPKNETEPEEEFKEPSIQDIIGSVNPEQIEMAEKMGIPLKALINYMAFQEQKLNLVIENMPKKEDMAEAFQQGLKALTAPQPNMTPGQPMPQGQAGLIAQLAQLAPLLPGLLGGGGQDNFYAEYGKRMMDRSFDMMGKQGNLVDAITNYVTNSLASKVAKGITESVEKE